MARRTTLKIGSDIRIISAAVSPPVRDTLGQTIFWNTGKLVKKSGQRFMVKVCNQTAWFDAEAVEAA